MTYPTDTYEPSLLFWTQHAAVHNFGDLLSEFILRRALVGPLYPAERYFLLGSALDDEVLQAELDALPSTDSTIACWGCGSRSEKGLMPAVSDRIAIFGVRGPLTRAVLRLDEATPLGDPALLLPLLHEPEVRLDLQGKSLCIPHFNEPQSAEVLAKLTGADIVLSPKVRSLDECETLVSAIASADFVLAGALHAAIVAAAYGKPFGFLDVGLVDVPFKWYDFAASIEMEPQFFADLESARRHFSNQVLRLPPLAPLLACCPWASRPDILASAIEHDVASGYGQDLRSTADRQVNRVSTARTLARERSLAKTNERDIDSSAREQALCREVLAELTDRRIAWESRLSAAAFSFFTENDQAPLLQFEKGSAGASMLAGRWIEPNQVGPISWSNDSAIKLRHHTGWCSAAKLYLDAIIFAPNVAPFHGRRELHIFCGNARLFEAEFSNDTPNESVEVLIEIPLPESLRAKGGDLELKFSFPVHGSPKEIGMRDDDRPIGLIPMRMWAHR